MRAIIIRRMPVIYSRKRTAERTTWPIRLNFLFVCFETFCFSPFLFFSILFVKVRKDVKNKSYFVVKKLAN